MLQLYQLGPCTLHPLVTDRQPTSEHRRPPRRCTQCTLICQDTSDAQLV